MIYLGIKRVPLSLVACIATAILSSATIPGYGGRSALGLVDSLIRPSSVNLIPMPQKVSFPEEPAFGWRGDGATLLIEGADRDLYPLLREVVGDLEQLGQKASFVGDGLSVPAGGVAFCKLVRLAEMEPAEYRLCVSATAGVRLEYGGTEGARYGLQTLRQLMTARGLPATRISDRPRFSYRGLMLDVSRHFMPKEFVLKLLDEMARYKLNRLHWHLTDGGGWRAEIRAYPALTQKTAYRTVADFEEWWSDGDRAHADSDAPHAYGGYYTREEMAEVVRYASERGIEVIPEIEMPSHSHEVLYAYPALSCTGQPRRYDRDLCLGNPDTYTFLCRVLDEMIALFPSRQIHIGGDEADMQSWKSCPKCQAVIRREGLGGVEGLQSYFFGKIADYLRSKGRTAIAWDEIGAGEIPEGTTIMSWRGEEGAIRAARQGHDAIMCPVGLLYLDYYQSDRRYEPLANGWTTTFMRTYGYDPLPRVLSEKEQQRIIGVQGNLWTEYVPTPSHAEYMIFPRLLSLAEIAWTDPARKDPKDFRRRVNIEVEKLRQRGVNSYRPSSLLQEKIEVDRIHKAIRVTLDGERDPAEIRYTTDGSIPTLRSKRYFPGDTLVVTDSARIVAAYFVDGVISGYLSKVSADYHRAIGKPLIWKTPLSRQFVTSGPETALVDGRRGTADFCDGIWLVTNLAQDNIAVLDLQEDSMVHSVSTRCMHQPGPRVSLPEWIELSISEDGQDYRLVGRIHPQKPPRQTRQEIETFTFFPNQNARYLKVHYHLPHPGDLLVTDELVVW